MVQFFRLINHQIEGAVMMFFSHQSVVLPVWLMSQEDINQLLSDSILCEKSK